jgi:hypothetical protein
LKSGLTGRLRAGGPPAWSPRSRPRRWTASANGAPKARFQSPLTSVELSSIIYKGHNVAMFRSHGRLPCEESPSATGPRTSHLRT